MSELSMCPCRKGTMFLANPGIAVSTVSGYLNVWCGFVCTCVYVCALNTQVDDEI